MKTGQQASKDLYYTNDHEWVDFQGTIAYTGVCAFKLTGFREIQQIVFSQGTGFKHQGELLATIRYNDYRIEAHMPVDGHIMRVNTELLGDERHLLLQHPERNGWIALIRPIQPYDRKGLILPEQYQLKRKTYRLKK
jgi:glycine cleavage system H protein